MGNALNKFGSSVSQVVRGRKRKRTEDESAEEGGDASDLLDQSLQQPKRKKLVSTAKYIYQALFKEERNSDVTVHALGKHWHLHKVYLSQSPYFASMFNGSWREAYEDYVHIEIIDPKITVESLYSVFGSLYMDEVVLDPKEIISTLATATLFQLDSLIERCAEVMVETTTAETAVLYYYAACEYGVKTVKESTFGWLLVNLLSFYHRAPKWLGHINSDLMVKLVSSPDLYVVQTEFTVYLLLRYWMTLKLFPDEPAQDGVEHPQERYYSKRTSNVPFLATPEGARFKSAFRAIRLQNLLNHHVDIQILRTDRIIPMKWLHKPLLQQWTSLLTIDQSLDRLIECEDRVFLESSVRCGRILNENVLHKWRWTGFHFGLDLLLSSDTRSLRIRRHHRTEHERLLSLRVKRQFLIRVSLTSLNELRQIKHQQTTPIMSITLEKNEDTQLLVFDPELTFPVLVSLNMMLLPPPEESPSKPSKKSKEKASQPSPSTSTARSERRSSNQSAVSGGGAGSSSPNNGAVESLDGGSSANLVPNLILILEH